MEGFDFGRTDRLDLFDINRTREEIFRDWVLLAGGDLTVALRDLIERAIEMDDELDAVRLMLDDAREKLGQPPLVHDRERREAHFTARARLRAREIEENGEPDDDENDGLTELELTYLHDTGMSPEAYLAERDEKPAPLERAPKLRVVRK
ncbi:hypothetical protein [Labrys sp. ZIDIC5]|uniref:hypothetical protein n=1 Tax=Labrys sedimenti TaxID=3106036 RepID=UPI002ACA2268|nr:hypothetical protein [Labrys sp. ZIDIC5]MDZ5448986.1 hypothetical protein [Labrys sp. ZIDIC5]